MQASVGCEKIVVLTKDGARAVKEKTEDRDLHIPSGMVPGEIHHLPPTSFNPGSLDGAKQNLRHFAKIMGMPRFVPKSEEKRCNLIVVEDGGGFAPTHKVICSSYLDPHCQLEFDSKQSFLEHWFQAHKELPINDLEDYREFKDIIVVCGGGHYEMNARKGFLSSKFAFEHFVKQTIQSCGFTDEQTKYQFSSDNHK